MSVDGGGSGGPEQSSGVGHEGATPPGRGAAEQHPATATQSEKPESPKALPGWYARIKDRFTDRFNQDTLRDRFDENPPPVTVEDPDGRIPRFAADAGKALAKPFEKADTADRSAEIPPDSSDRRKDESAGSIERTIVMQAGSQAKETATRNRTTNEFEYKVGEVNQDAQFTLPEKNAFGVFDGVGGHAAGDKAAQLARDFVQDRMAQLPDGLSAQDREAALRKILIDANAAVLAEAQGNEMGTTAAIGQVWEDDQGTRRATIANAGDSPVFLFRDGHLEQITIDDNYASIGRNDDEARELQARWSNFVGDDSLTSEEAYIFDNKRNVITQSLGSETVAPRTYTIELQEGDRLLACSDGISDNLTADQIEEILTRGRGADNTTTVQDLIKNATAISRRPELMRAKKDDMTALVIDIDRPEDRQTASVQPSTPESAQKDTAARDAAPDGVDSVTPPIWDLDDWEDEEPPPFGSPPIRDEGAPAPEPGREMPAAARTLIEQNLAATRGIVERIHEVAQSRFAAGDELGEFVDAETGEPADENEVRRIREASADYNAFQEAVEAAGIDIRNPVTAAQEELIDWEDLHEAAATNDPQAVADELNATLQDRKEQLQRREAERRARGETGPSPEIDELQAVMDDLRRIQSHLEAAGITPTPEGDVDDEDTDNGPVLYLDEKIAATTDERERQRLQEIRDAVDDDNHEPLRKELQKDIRRIQDERRNLLDNNGSQEEIDRLLVDIDNLKHLRDELPPPPPEPVEPAQEQGGAIRRFLDKLTMKGRREARKQRRAEDAGGFEPVDDNPPEVDGAITTDEQREQFEDEYAQAQEEVADLAEEEWNNNPDITKPGLKARINTMIMLLPGQKKTAGVLLGAYGAYIAYKTGAIDSIGDNISNNIAIPDVNLPDVNLPDVNIPDVNLPDVNLPDFNLPDFNRPDFNRPDWLPGGDSPTKSLGDQPTPPAEGKLPERSMPPSGEVPIPPDVQQEIQGMLNSFEHTAVKGDTRWEVISDFVEQNKETIPGGNWENPENGVTKADVIADMWTTFQERHGIDADKLQVGETVSFADWNKFTDQEKAVFLEALQTGSAEQYVSDVMPKFEQVTEAPVSTPQTENMLGDRDRQINVNLPGGQEYAIDIPQGTRPEDLQGIIDTHSAVLESRNIPPTIADYIVSSTIENGLNEQGVTIDIPQPKIDSAAMLQELNTIPEFNALMNQPFEHQGGPLWPTIEKLAAPVDTLRGWESEKGYSTLSQIVTDMIIDNSRANGFDVHNVEPGQYTLAQVGVKPEQIGEFAARAFAQESASGYANNVMKDYIEAKRNW